MFLRLVGECADHPKSAIFGSNYVKKRMNRNVLAQQDVLRLDIAVNDVHLVTVLHGIGNAEDVFRGSTLAEALFGHEFFVDFSLRSVLQNEVDTLLIPEISIHSQNIAMSISQQF